MKVRAEEIKDWSSTAAASEAFVALVASSSGSTSKPFRNGSSASLTFSNAASTSADLAFPSRRNASVITRSRCSFVRPRISPIVFCTALHRSASFDSAALSEAGPPPEVASMTRSDALSVFCAVSKAVPICSMSSSEGLADSMPRAASSAPGLTLRSACLTSSSISVTNLSCSATISLPLMSLSPEAAARFAFDKSPLAALMRWWSLFIASEFSWPRPLLLALKTFRASFTASDASFSTAEVFSFACLRRSSETESKSSAKKTSAASVILLTALSAVVTLSWTSASKADALRSEVSFLKVVSFFETASNRCWWAFSSSVTLAANSLPYFLVSASLVLMKFLAVLTADSAFDDAVSESLIAFEDSSAGRISIPLRNGISASVHFVSACSATSMFSPAVRNISRVPRLSRCLRSTDTTDSTLFLKPAALSFITVSSSFMAPSAAPSFWSNVLIALSMLFLAGRTTFSTDWISSSLIWPCSAADDIIVAFSSSSSAAASCSASSDSCFRAATRAWKSFLNCFNGFSFFCASVSFCCRPVNSPRASFRVSGANLRAFCRASLIRFRASVIFSCASVAAVSTSSMAWRRRSLDSSGGSAMSGAARAWTASTDSSDNVTTSCVAGKDSCSSLLSRSSAAFCAASFSAFFFSLTAPSALLMKFRNLLPSVFSWFWRLRNRGDNLDNSVTEDVADTPPFLASVMSCVSAFCPSCKADCCFSMSCFMRRRASTSVSADADLQDATAAFAATSNFSTEAVARFTRACRFALDAAPWPDAPLLLGGAEDGGFERVGGGGGADVRGAAAALDDLAPALSTRRSPCSARCESHGTRQPTRGGAMLSDTHRAHTCEPPTWSPNHQPLKSAPSRLSQ
mmetsp:Transcript_88882/g.272244  ORF Transcript_88882/g.272244 Transcript_88882/m.272244 type:complete len:862 (+) Transcript_88882:307-2892(+)